jgi:hypothetical protein
MTERIRWLSVAALLLITATAPACYTLLKHPRLASLDYERPGSNRCIECHSSADIWKFNHSKNMRTHNGTGGDWSAYYDVPWWYERRWDYAPRTEPKKEENENTTDRHSP